MKPPPPGAGSPPPDPAPLNAGAERSPAGGENAGARAAGHRPAADLGLLVCASLALILPGWLASPSAGRPRLSGVAEAPRRIDVNAAPWYEWTLLEGVGEARARRIVDLRSERGGFASLDELEQVPGMPEGWVERIRPFLTMGDRRGTGRPEPAGATMGSGKVDPHGR